MTGNVVLGDYDPMPPAEPEISEQPWTRLSNRMLFVHVATDLIRAVPALAGLLLAGSSSGHSGLFGLAGAVVAIILAVVRWLSTRYRITASQVQLRTGLLRRKRMTVPLDRVRTVDVQATLFHRLVGLTKLKMGTGRPDTEKEKGLTLDGLTVAQASTLRDDLLHRRGQPVAVTSADGAVAAVPADAPQVDELVRLDPAWIRYGPFTMTGLVTVVAVAGLAWRIVNEAHVDPNKYSAFRTVRHHIDHTAVGLLAVQVALVLMVLVALLSTAGYVLAFWRFLLVRTGEGTLHVTRGLLTTRSTTIEERRLRGLELSEPLLLRAVHGARVIAVATGLRVGRGAERGGSVLLPPAPRKQADQLAADVLGTVRPLDVALRRHPAAAQRRRFTRAGGVALIPAAATVLAVLLGAPESWLVVGAVVLLLTVPLALDRYGSLGHQVSDGYLVVREGTLVRRRIALGADSVIGWNLRQSFFQRRAGVATLTATTACGRQQYRALDLAAGAAVPLADEVLPGLLAPFLVAPDQGVGTP